MTVQSESVDTERVRQHVEVLERVPDRVSAAQPQLVVDGAVDALDIVAAPVQPHEVIIAGQDGTDVLGSVELAAPIVVVAVKSNDQRVRTQIAEGLTPATKATTASSRQRLEPSAPRPGP